MATGFYEIRSFMAARGPCYVENAPSPRYKLCVVATDLEHLIEFLRRAVNRPDGYYVKYSPSAKDGMYLGRVFLSTNQALGELWAEAKTDTKLLASIQDDHFIAEYRSPESVAAAKSAGE